MLPKKPPYRQAQLLNKKNNNQASHPTQSRFDISQDESHVVEGEKDEQPSLAQNVPPKVRLNQRVQELMLMVS
jgi:hypothetical protein